MNTGTTSGSGLFISLIIILIIIMLAAIIMAITTKGMVNENRKRKIVKNNTNFSKYLKNLDSDQIVILLNKKMISDTKSKIDTNAYGKGDQNKFLIEGSETPQSVPYWVWILIIGIVGWLAYYLITYLSIKT